MPHTATETSAVATAPNPTNPTIPSPSQLSATQHEVIASLARGRTITAAAAEARVHRCTIHDWMRSSAAFRLALEDAHLEYKVQLKDYMKELSSVALETVRAFLQDPQVSPPVRLRAALAILGRHDWQLPANAEPNLEKEVREWKLLRKHHDYPGPW